jgi:hypothetical protein
MEGKMLQAKENKVLRNFSILLAKFSSNYM